MFEILAEAAKLGERKGIYILAFDSRNNHIQVLDRRTGEINFIINSDDEQMISSTSIYFGLKNRVIVNA